MNSNSNEIEKLSSSSSELELDLDRPNLEDYLPSGSSIQEPRGKLRLYFFFSYSLSLCLVAEKIMEFWCDCCKILNLFFGKFTYLFLIIFCSRDLLDISPTLTEAAGAIIDVSFFIYLFFFYFFFFFSNYMRNELCYVNIN